LARRGGLSLGLAAIFSLLLATGPATVLAQDVDESPQPQPVDSAEPSGAEAGTEGSGGPVFPSTLAGGDLTVETYSGPQWLAEFADSADSAAFVEGTNALLASVGKDIDDLTVRSALAQPSEGNQAVILALQIAGASSRDFALDAVRLLLGDVNDPRFTLRPLGSRWVLRVSDAAVPGVYPRTVYLADDTAWIIGADDVYLEELLDQLPAQEYAEVAGSAVLASQLPAVLDDRRRTGLYELKEPLYFLPTLEARLGPAMDQWMLDLYMDSGLTPTDLVGAIAWWGLTSPDESVEVEGYQVPGASPELVERFRSEVFLNGGESLPGEASRSEQELGGRPVTSIDLGFTKQHIFSSGDTVWVVTDHVDEPAMAEEAIAALP